MFSSRQEADSHSLLVENGNKENGSKEMSHLCREFDFSPEFQGASLRTKSRPEWVVQKQPDTVEEKMKEDEEVNIWRVIENWGSISYADRSLVKIHLVWGS